MLHYEDIQYVDFIWFVSSKFGDYYFPSVSLIEGWYTVLGLIYKDD